MKHSICLLVALFSIATAFGQSDTIDYDAAVSYVQIEPSFPGGIAAWKRYLERNQDARLVKKCDDFKRSDTLSQQTVVVSFLVNKEGLVTEVVALNEKEVCPALAAASVQLIKKGPKWMPAQLHGRNVIYRAKQNINWVRK